MTDKVAREMTFEEEAKLYKEETAEFLKSETVDSEPPFVNSILRRGNRIIRKASAEIERLQAENRRLKKSVDNQCDDCACEIADERDKLKTENDELFYKLSGVMLSVDKWLDGEELNQDEVNRAIIMREKTLQITERLKAERDKAVEDLADVADCIICKYDDVCENSNSQGCCNGNWQWRGLEESE